nr:hypothetical protein [Actinoplanes sp. N902-109]
MALISRSKHRHDGYVQALRSAGVRAAAFAADATDPGRLRAAVAGAAEQFGPIGVAYYGPGAADPAQRPAPVIADAAWDLTERRDRAEVVLNALQPPAGAAASHRAR